MLIDSHCHLDFPDFADELAAVVERAHEAKINTLLTICTQVTNFDLVRAIAERYDGIYCSVGIHPHNAASEPEIRPDHLIQMASHPKVVGIGETGLDYHYDLSPRDRQRKNFRTHIEAARATGLPLIVHSREAEEDTAEILADEVGKGAFTGVMHCFSSRQKRATAAIDLGLYMSMSGIVTFKNANELREIAKDIPDDRLLVETDAPYLAPVPRRGKRNEPAFVTHTAEKVAKLRGVTLESLAVMTTDNFYRLFSKAVRPAKVATS